MVCKLKKVIYEVKQSFRVCYEKFFIVAAGFGFQRGDVMITLYLCNVLALVFFSCSICE